MLRHSSIMDSCTRTDKFTLPVCGSSESMFQEQPALHVMVDLNLPSQSSADSHTGIFEEVQCSSSTRQKSPFNEAVYCENPGIAFILGIGGESDDDEDEDSNPDEFGPDLNDFVWELEFYPLQEHCIVTDICNIGNDSFCNKHESQSVIDILANENRNDYVASADCVDGICEHVNNFTSRLEEINKKWNMETKDTDQENKKSAVKVHFAPQDSLATVHFVEEFDRTGPWYQYAVDRNRFTQRILELEPILSPCFESGHRAAVYKRLHHC